MNPREARSFLRVKLPFAYSSYLAAREFLMPLIFARIYRSRGWGDGESVSGSGSSLAATEKIREALRRLIIDRGMRSILDIPCGDHLWMNHVNLGECKYYGADIVKDLIKENASKYGGKTKQFVFADITKDALPQVDLIFCRDCLVHLSFTAIKKALGNIRASNSRYILMTTFPERNRNEDVAVGGWRPLNFQKPPFNFPEPLLLINEDCKENQFKDKSLGLWSVDLLPTPRL